MKAKFFVQVMRLRTEAFSKKAEVNERRAQIADYLQASQISAQVKAEVLGKLQASRVLLADFKQEEKHLNNLALIAEGIFGSRRDLQGKGDYGTFNGPLKQDFTKLKTALSQYEDSLLAAIQQVSAPVQVAQGGNQGDNT